MTDMISRAAAIAANPIETAPKDGTMLRLLVDYTDDGANPLEDEHQAWTIGFNQLSDTEEDVWEFAGWSWEQDCFTTGFGKVIGWLPFHARPAAQVADPAQIREAAQYRQLAAWLRNPWSKMDGVERGPIPEWQGALMFEAANVIEAMIATPPSTEVKTAAQDYTLEAAELSLPAVSDDVADQLARSSSTETA